MRLLKMATAHSPAMHAGTLRDYDRNSAPVEDVLGYVWARMSENNWNKEEVKYGYSPSGPSQYHPISTKAWTIVTRSSS